MIRKASLEDLNDIYNIEVLSFETPCEAELITIAVDEGCRRQGIGKALFAHMKKLYGENVLWHLEVACENNGAIQLYKGFGFEITSTIANYYGDGKNAFRMILSPNN